MSKNDAGRVNELMEEEDQMIEEMREEFRTRFERRLQGKVEEKERGLVKADPIIKKK